MAKTFYPVPQALPVVTTNATSVGPDFMRTITLSEEYKTKTRMITLILENGVERRRVYRESGSVPGYFSCDVYELKTDEWTKVDKEEWKTYLPEPPAGAVLTTIEGVPFWTFRAMTEEEIARHRAELLAAR